MTDKIKDDNIITLAFEREPVPQPVTSGGIIKLPPEYWPDHLMLEQGLIAASNRYVEELAKLKHMEESNERRTDND